MKKYFIIILAMSFLSCSVKYSVDENSSDSPKVKSIILMIGDGMGLTQVSSAYLQEKANLNLKKIKNIGLMSTYSSDNLITDSAAGATALACGVKSYNGAIGINSSKVSQKTILEYFEEKDCATGLIATCTITHATPACFAAHQEKRSMHNEIAVDISNQNIDVLIGGGKRYFTNRKDNLELFDKMENNGYGVYSSIEEMKTAKEEKLISLVADKNLPKVSKGRGDYLQNSTQIALDKLSQNDNGFFLMVEGSQIDWGGHDNDGNYVISELIDFDKAVGVAIEFVNKNPETLLIVTADHETGGMAITGGNYEEGKVECGFVSKHHTGTLIPVFAYGVGSENFRGFYDNTDIFKKMYKLKFD